MTTVVRVNRKQNKFTLYIGRKWAGLPASKWANPFHLYRYKDGVSVPDRNWSLQQYEHHVRTRPDLMAALHEIDDQVLGCWCHETPSDGSGDPF